MTNLNLWQKDTLEWSFSKHFDTLTTDEVGRYIFSRYLEYILLSQSRWDVLWADFCDSWMFSDMAI